MGDLKARVDRLWAETGGDDPPGSDLAWWCDLFGNDVALVRAALSSGADALIAEAGLRAASEAAEALGLSVRSPGWSDHPAVAEAVDAAVKAMVARIQREGLAAVLAEHEEAEWAAEAREGFHRWSPTDGWGWHDTPGLEHEPNRRYYANQPAAWWQRWGHPKP